MTETTDLWPMVQAVATNCIERGTRKKGKRNRDLRDTWFGLTERRFGMHFFGGTAAARGRSGGATPLHSAEFDQRRGSCRSSSNVVIRKQCVMQSQQCPVPKPVSFAFSDTVSFCGC